MTPELLSQIVTVMAGFVVFAFAGKVIEIAYTVIKKLAPIVFAAVVVIVAATAIIDPTLSFLITVYAISITLPANAKTTKPAITVTI